MASRRGSRALTPEGTTLEAYPNAQRFLPQPQLEQKTTPDQRPLVEAALLFLACVGHLALFRRILASVRHHGGVTCPQKTRVALLSSTDRHVRKRKPQGPAARVRHLQCRPEQHVGQTARVPPEHLGPLGEFWVARPRTTLEEGQAFLHDQRGMQVSRSTVETTLPR